MKIKCRSYYHATPVCTKSYKRVTFRKLKKCVFMQPTDETSKHQTGKNISFLMYNHNLIY